MRKTTQLGTPVVLAITLAAAGCGGTTKPPSAGTGGTPPKNIVSSAYKFSRCMRQHGVSGFPDPVVNSSPGHQSVGIQVTPTETGSPRFASAQKACQGIMPGSGNGDSGRSPQQLAAHIKGMVAFAGCMRSRHVPTFPDPSTQGQITPAMLSAANINLHAPAVRAAAIACVPASQGQLSAAQVTQALGPG